MTAPSTYTPSLDALKALAHPLRVELWEELGRGPSTASRLAALFGESSGSTSYHLRQLARHGFVEEAPELGNGRERWWRTPQGRVRLYSDEVTASPAGRAAVDMVLTETVRLAMTRVQEYQHRLVSGAESDWHDEALLTLGTRSATRAELGELTTKLSAVLETWMNELDARPEPTDARRVQLTLAAFPLAPARAPASADDDRASSDGASHDTAAGGEAR